MTHGAEPRAPEPFVEPSAIQLVETTAELERLACEWACTDWIALDTEANDMHAYRGRLCTVQVAWRVRRRERDDAGVSPTSIAVIDALSVDLAPLREILSARGPLKILHDLTFDARMLAESGMALEHVADTSIFARFLGRSKTGLATLVAEHSGVALDKRLQRHDWSARPLTLEHLAYLAGDVVHLRALYEGLRREAEERDVLEEIELECATRVRRAGALDIRPGWERLSGFRALDGAARARLVRLFGAREEIARRLDRPAGRVLSNDSLCEFARRGRVERGLLRASRSEVHAPDFERALTLARDDTPHEVIDLEPLWPPAKVARHKRMRSALAAWRTREAAARCVDEQVVLPGYVLDALCATLLDEPPPADAATLRASVSGLEGMGPRRLERYWDAWFALLRRLDDPG